MRQHGPSAVEVGKCAAAVDIGNEHARGVAIAGYAHVYNVAGGEVYFGRRARAFNDYNVVFGTQGI